MRFFSFIFVSLFLALEFSAASFARPAIEHPVMTSFQAQRPIYKKWPRLLNIFSSKEPRFRSTETDGIYKFQLNFADVYIVHSTGQVSLSYHVSEGLLESDYDKRIQEDISNTVSIVQKKYPHFSIKVASRSYDDEVVIYIDPLPESIETLTFLNELGATLKSTL